MSEESRSGEHASPTRDAAPESDGRGSRDGGDVLDSLPPQLLCDLCGHPMRESHCKLICDQCGYTRDCSDP